MDEHQVSTLFDIGSNPIGDSNGKIKWLKQDPHNVLAVGSNPTLTTK